MNVLADQAQMAACPVCSNDRCVVRELFAQATRHEAMRSLGRHAYCPTCDVSFRAPEMLQESFG